MRLFILIFTLLSGSALAQDTPTVYRYDDQGIYVGAETPQESPLEPGVFLDPKNTTRVAPPISQGGFTIVWDGNAWTYVEDHRGKEVYSKVDGSPYKVNELGPLSDSYTEIPKPGEFYEWDALTNTWVENTAKKEAVAEQIARQRDLLEDADTKTLDDALRVATPEQIETYVRNKVNALGCTSLSTCQQSLQRIERAIIEILKREAAQAQAQ